MESQIVPLEHGITVWGFAKGLIIDVSRALIGMQVVPINRDQTRHLS
jgi:hypothetical protein